MPPSPSATHMALAESKWVVCSRPPKQACCCIGAYCGGVSNTLLVLIHSTLFVHVSLFFFSVHVHFVLIGVVESTGIFGRARDFDCHAFLQSSLLQKKKKETFKE